MRQGWDTGKLKAGNLVFFQGWQWGRMKNYFWWFHLHRWSNLVPFQMNNSLGLSSLATLLASKSSLFERKQLHCCERKQRDICGVGVGSRLSPSVRVSKCVFVGYLPCREDAGSRISLTSPPTFCLLPAYPLFFLIPHNSLRAARCWLAREFLVTVVP